MAAAPPASGTSVAVQEQAFVSRLAELTGLDPKVIQAWVNVEGAYAPNGTGGYNFLNIRESTSRSGVPITGTTSRGFAHFRNGADAATEAAYILEHSSIYQGIRRATQLGPRSQLAAIAASPWDAGHYGGGRALYNAYDSLVHGGSSLLSGVGHVASGVGHAVADAASGNPLGAAKDVADQVPGLGGVSSALDAPAAIANDITKVLGFVFNPQDWLRVGYILAGGVFVIGGLFILARSVGSSTVASSALQLLGPEEQAASRAAAPRTRTRTVYVTDPEENRRESVRRRAARAEPSNDIPF